jgi:hypothetical protein
MGSCVGNGGRHVCLAQIRGLNLNSINFIVGDTCVFLLPPPLLLLVLLMGLCTGCAVLFQGLDGPLCMKCMKLAAAPSSAEREAIEVSSILPLYDSMTVFDSTYYRNNRSAKSALWYIHT